MTVIVLDIGRKDGRSRRRKESKKIGIVRDTTENIISNILSDWREWEYMSARRLLKIRLKTDL